MEYDTGNHVVSKVFKAGGLKCESSTSKRKGTTSKCKEQLNHIRFDCIPFYLQNKLQRGKKVLFYIICLYWKNYSA